MESEKDNIPAKGYRYTITDQPPIRFDVALQPWKGSTPPTVSIEPLHSDPPMPADATALKVATPGYVDYIVFSPQAPVRFSSHSEELSFEGRLLLLRCSNAKPVRLAGRDITGVTFAGKDIPTDPSGPTDILLDK